MDSKYIIVFVTVDSHDAAKEITDVLLDERKAACVNIVPGVESHFWWQRKKETAQELLLIIKTRTELLNELVTLVKTHHPYSIPEIIALPIIGGNADYLKWLQKETE